MDQPRSKHRDADRSQEAAEDEPIRGEAGGPTRLRNNDRRTSQGRGRIDQGQNTEMRTNQGRRLREPSSQSSQSQCVLRSGGLLLTIHKQIPYLQQLVVNTTVDGCLKLRENRTGSHGIRRYVSRARLIRDSGLPGTFVNAVGGHR